jgi:trimeric autotransporter adhesin
MKNNIKLLSFLLILAIGCQKPEVVITPPTLDAVTISEVSTASARLSTNISDSGNQDISDYGFVYSEANASPTLGDSKTTHGKIDPTTPTPIAFTDVIQNLKPNTTYNVRAYSTISSGPVFGNVISFKTSDVIQPKIRTDAVSSVTINSAKMQGTIEAKGTNDISEYGIVWSSTNTSPTTADSKVAKTGNITTFPNSFSFEITNLTVNTNYNYRAYVISNGVTTYANTLNFRTLTITQPTITTDAASNISFNSAKLQGTVSAKGTFDISEYGICWSSTNTNPTTADIKLTKTGNIATVPSSFTIDATNLAVNTTFNYRAYVISNGVTTYGNTLTFNTLAVTLPSVKTDAILIFTVNSAMMRGIVESKGSYDVSEYGICWSSRNTVPTTADSKSSKVSTVTIFPTIYSVSADGLSPNTTYYFRAFVVSNGITTYGGVLSFKTNAVVLPTLSTDGQTIVTDLNRTLNGTLLTKGSYDITEYGMCWSFSNVTPTTADTKGSKTGNPSSFPTRFTISASGLQGSRTYYYRAYVISNGVTTYGSVLNFSTGKN